MFDDQQQPRQPIDIKPSLIFLACAGGGILLSFGLCGVAASLHTVNRVNALGGVGFALFGLSLLAILVAVFWLLGVVLINAFRR